MNRIRRQFSRACNHLKYKVIFLGDFGVGKTTLFTWLKDGEPPDTQCSISNCIGIDKCSVPFTLQDGQEVQMEFWDTADSERYHTLTKNYYRLCNAIVLVYDASNPATLSSLKDWIEDAKRYAPSNTTFMLLANKYDLWDSAETQESQLGEAFADLHDIPLYFKISARNGDKDSLSELFLRLAEFIHNKDYKSSGRRFATFQLMPEESTGLSASIDDQLLQRTCYNNDGKFGKKSNCASCSK